MPDYIQALIQRVPVPNQPHFSQGSFSWEEVEAAVGVPLPEDYKALISAYGYGWFARYLSLYSPFEHDSPDGFIKTITMFSHNIHSSRMKFPEFTLPFDLYPYEPLVPLGFTDDMGLILWKASPDGDRIVTIDADISPNFGEYQKSISQFIYEWINGEFVPYGFDNAEEIPDKAIFTPL